MKKNKEKFVDRYDSILNMKKGIKTQYSLFLYVYHLLAFILVLGIFLGLGYFTNTNQNLNYVAYSIIAAVFGSFLFIRLYTEEKLQEEFGIQYSKFVAIALDMSKLLYVLLMVTLLLFYFVYGRLVSNFDYLFIVLLLSILTLGTNVVFKFNYKYKLLDFNVIFNIICIHLFFMFAFEVFSFQSILFNTLFWTVILLVIYIVKDFIGRLHLSFTSRIELYLLFILAVCIIVIVPRKDKIYYFDSNRLEDYINLKPNYNLEIPELPASMKYKEYVDVESYENIYVTKGRLILFERDDLEELSVTIIENEDVSEESILYSFLNRSYLETIVQEDGEIIRNTYILENNALVLESTKTLNSPVYFHEYHEYTRSINSTSNNDFRFMNNKFYSLSNLGVAVYDTNFEFIYFIDFLSTSNQAVALFNDNQNVFLFIRNGKNSEETYLFEILKINEDNSISKIIDFESENRTYKIPFVKDGKFYISDYRSLYEINDSGLSEMDLSNNEVFYEDNHQIYIGSLYYDDAYRSNVGAYNNGSNVYLSGEEYYVSNIESFLGGDNSEDVLLKGYPQELFVSYFFKTNENFIIIDKYYLYKFDFQGNYINRIAYATFNQQDFYVVGSTLYKGTNYINPSIYGLDLDLLGEEIFSTRETRSLNYPYYYIGYNIPKRDVWTNMTFELLFISASLIIIKTKKD